MAADDICRTCISQNDVLCPIVSLEDLPIKLFAITGIDISSEKYLPTSICTECIININFLYSFKNAILENDEKLKTNARNLDCTAVILAQEITENLEQFWKSEISTPDEEAINEESCIINEIIDLDNFDDVENMENIVMSEENVKNTGICDDNTIQLKENVIKSVPCLTRNKQVSSPKIQKGQQIKCDKCSYTNVDSRNLKRHIRRMHGPRKKSKCTICKKDIISYFMKQHLRTHTDDKYTCEICGLVFKNLQSFKSHPQMHIREESVCPKCGKTFQYRGEYKRHQQQHRNLYLRKKTCEICNKKVIDLKQHKVMHSKEQKYKCEYCGKKFLRKHNMEAHLRRHSDKRFYFSCEICDKRFMRRVSLILHRKNLHDENNIKTIEIEGEEVSQGRNFTTQDPNKIVKTVVVKSLLC